MEINVFEQVTSLRKVLIAYSQREDVSQEQQQQIAKLLTFFGAVADKLLVQSLSENDSTVRAAAEGLRQTTAAIKDQTGELLNTAQTINKIASAAKLLEQVAGLGVKLLI